jgi:SAM-dependent methyltransferase
MEEYWESKYREEGAPWKFEEADSAKIAMDLFKSEGFKHILIPGVGYGRNAGIFHRNGFKLTGIEISRSAIELAQENGLDFRIHHGSVVSMPFDDEMYDGIFCYALIHLLNKNERKRFLNSCFNQLKNGGVMIFVLATKKLSMYGSGKFLSKDRYEISKGLKVFFYDDLSVSKEFSEFGLSQFYDIAEPVKFVKGYDPMPLKFVLCRKNVSK